MEDSTSGCLGLRFTGLLPDIIYTMDKVKAENTKDLRVELIDTRTGEVVNSGPESSMKVQLNVLHGKFKGAETGIFSLKCFEHNILTRKKDNGPLLLLGDNFLNLNEGTAVVGNLKITANSRWIPSGCFRLAARVTDGDFKGMRVKEAITNAFVVVEDRLKSIKKHYPPRLEDDVWRLEGIAKNGKYHQRLKDREINKVQDFMKSLQNNRNGLRDEVIEQQSVQTVDEQPEENFLSNAHIRIQNDGSLYHQQIGGSSLLPRGITSQPLAECSHMAVNGTSKSGDTFKHFGLAASTCPGEKSPAVDMIPFHNKLQENEGCGFRLEYPANLEQEFSLDDFSLSPLEYLGLDPAGFVNACFNEEMNCNAVCFNQGMNCSVSSISVEMNCNSNGKHEGKRWSMLKMAMMFTRGLRRSRA